MSRGAVLALAVLAVLACTVIAAMWQREALMLAEDYSSFKPIYKRTFTWFSRNLNLADADWCGSLGFTDVVDRFDDDSNASASNLASKNVRYWRYVGHWFFIVPGKPANDYTIDYFTSVLRLESSRSPDGRIYVDDCHLFMRDLGRPALDRFLEAARTMEADKLILDFYVADGATLDTLVGCNLSGLDVDFYHPPTVDVRRFLPTIHYCHPRSAGLMLWAWNGTGSNGVSWGQMTEQLIRKKYVEATQYGFSRFMVWDGHETDDIQQGLSWASLYNYPEWWSLVQAENQLFSSS